MIITDRHLKNQPLCSFSAHLLDSCWIRRKCLSIIRPSWFSLCYPSGRVTLTSPCIKKEEFEPRQGYIKDIKLTWQSRHRQDSLYVQLVRAVSMWCRYCIWSVSNLRLRRARDHRNVRRGVLAHFFCGGLWINIYDFITLSMSMSDCGRKLRRTIGLQREGKLNANLILPRLVWTSNGLLKAVYYNTGFSKYLSRLRYRTIWNTFYLQDR